MADEATKLRLALALAKRGLYIAPLVPETKLPYEGESWKKIRSRDPEVIRGWFSTRPHMNYAVSPGEEYVVLDLDTKKGKKGAADLEEQAIEAGDYSAYEETFTVKTPSRGQHRYFKTPFPVSNAHTLPKSIDVRGTDGYVVGPGCHTTHNAMTNTMDGEYELINKLDIMPLPEWVEPRLQRWYSAEDKPSYEDSVEEIDGKNYIDGVEIDQADRVERAIEWLQHGAKPAIEFQGGNQTTFNTFAWLREHAISTDLALEIVAKHYNPRAVDSRGDPCPWSYEELERIRDNAYKYAKRSVSQVGGMEGQLISEADIIASSQNIDPNIMLQRFAADSALANSKLQLAEAIERRKQDNELDAHTWYGDGVLTYPSQKEFVIPHVLPAYGYVGFLARRGTGKTTVMMDMALRLAHDMDWHGQPMKMGWGALVLAGEDAEGAKDQIMAWMKLHGVEHLSKRFVFMDAIANLLNPDSMVKWLEHFKKISKDMRFVVFADTWQIATAGGSQNEDDTMQVAISNTKLIAKAVRGPAIMAAHPPKGNEDTWSGAAVMENHSQALWKLTRETFGMNFSVPRIKGTQADYLARFEFRSQGLGYKDEWGADVMGIVPLKIGGEGVASDGEAGGQRMRTIRQAYGQIIYALINEAEESEPDFAKKRNGAFSMNGTAKRIADATVAGKCKSLEQLGETTLHPINVRKRVEELFSLWKQPLLVDNVAGNPITLVLHKPQGKTHGYFRIMAGKIKPESDEEQQIPPNE